MRLLQSTWAEILTLTMAYRSLPQGNGKLHYASDFILDERQARECGAFEIHALVLIIMFILRLFATASLFFIRIFYLYIFYDLLSNDRIKCIYNAKSMVVLIRVV